LLRICFGDYDREMVLVAEQRAPHTGIAEIVGVGRLNKLSDHNNEAEVAVLVSDPWQNQLGFNSRSNLAQPRSTPFWSFESPE
jgi:acetyltransferase